MKNIVFPVVCLVCLIFPSCAVVDNDLNWSKEEKKILTQVSDVVPVYTVANEGNAALLRQSSKQLSRKMLRSSLYKSLTSKMIATVTDPSQDGVGIAGPQIGISRRVVCVQRFDKEGEPFEVYPNIRIISERGEKVNGPEGCLSVPDRRGQVLRSRDIDIGYTSESSLKDTVERIQGFTAVIFQHECDHLDGILYTDRIWSEKDAWFSLDGTDTAPQEDWADVFYLVSTNIISDRTDDGDTLYLASLTPEQKAVISKEIGYVAKHVFNDSLNFFSPFYHQHTVEAIYLSPERFGELEKQLTAEVYEAFCYYMDNLNNGRPYILAGFSQGANLAKEILKKMTPEQYSKMAAAYLLGWGINEDDLKYPYIRPAQTADDRGVTISYNTVSKIDGIWNLVMDSTCCCINPVNWMTDNSPASFQYKDQNLRVHVDTSYNVLVVDNFKKEPVSFVNIWPENCLHHFEFLFFEDQLRENAKLRAYGR